MSFRFLTAGESHGKALIGILEGMPSGLEISESEIFTQLQRRKLGWGRGARQKIESDAVEILSGVRFGKTLGSPVALMIRNQDWQAWQEVMQVEAMSSSEPSKRLREVHVPRPGHADLIGGFKYQHTDMRNVLERSSARETTMRVALASVARKLLEVLGVSIVSRVTRIGSVQDTSLNEEVLANSTIDASPVRCLNREVEKEMIELIEKAKKEGNTLGGEFEVYAFGVPVGLGSYAHWDRRLEAEIGKSFLSLNAIKGVEIGLGFQAASIPGSEVHDEMIPGASRGGVSFRSNRSGGIDGGMSTGQPLVVRAAMKPLSTLMKPLQSVNLKSQEPEAAHIERSDVCAVPSAAVIGESLLALVLVEKILEKFGGDSLEELQSRVLAWKEKCWIE